MLSPYPGMDPYLEGDEWEDFYTRFLTMVSGRLSPSLPNDYAARVERRIYIENPPDHNDRSYRQADVAVLRQFDTAPRRSDAGSGQELSGETSFDTATMTAPVVCQVPMPTQRREAFLVLRHLPDMEVVTVIELLSPANKRPGGDGRRTYNQKRQEILCSQSNLVEIDLLLGGEPPPLSPRPPGDYRVTIARVGRRPEVDVYAWPLLRTMPAIPVPLRKPDPDVSLDLQEVFRLVYQQADYRKTIRYENPSLAPPPDR